MKYITTSQLVVGDIFTKKMQVKDREAFTVLEVIPTEKGNKLLVKSRNLTHKTIEPKTIPANDKEIIWLRNDPNVI